MFSRIITKNPLYLFHSILPSTIVFLSMNMRFVFRSGAEILFSIKKCSVWLLSLRVWMGFNDWRLMTLFVSDFWA